MPAIFWSAVLAVAVGASPDDYFLVQVVDDQTGRGVPLVELRTVHDVRYFTDSNGLVAINEPGLVGQTVFLHVASHGYEFPADGFGIRGARCKVTPGETKVLKIKRLNIAQRLYRVTGAGIYRDTLLAGREAPLEHPVLNAQVFGSDSAMNAVYRERIYWFWGDTNRPSYPLGNFHTPGATSHLPTAGGLDPAIGVDLAYFEDEHGFVKPTAKMPGDGPTWLSGLMVVPDEQGRERMLAAYAKIEPPLDVYERGLVEFDAEANVFQWQQKFPLDATAVPGGHPFRHTAAGEEFEYVYFAEPYPLVRAPATQTAVKDLARYESFTCVRSVGDDGQATFDRDQAGRLRYAWRRGVPRLDAKQMKTWIDQQQVAAEESLFQLRDLQTGKAIQAHGGSVYWNHYRKRWLMIFIELFGTSVLGEAWYAESPTPTGPWIYARKIVTHDKYSFYNPKQHPMFDQDGGRTIFFEGTYTNMFSGNDDRTPRYNYNQIMYRLDLDDPRLSLPVPVFAEFDGDRLVNLSRTPPDGWTGSPAEVPFYAFDQPGENRIALFADRDDAGNLSLTTSPAARAESTTGSPAFFALPADLADPPSATRPLFAHRHATGGETRYSPSADLKRPEFQRLDQPLCRVWHNPVRYVVDR